MATEVISKGTRLSLYNRFFLSVGGWFLRHVKHLGVPKTLQDWCKEFVESQVTFLAGVHDQLIELDNRTQILMTSILEEASIVECQKILEDLERTLKWLLPHEHRFLLISRDLAALGYPIKGADELEEKYRELKAGLEEEWAYDSPAFDRIIQLAEKERQAGKVEEWP